MNYMGSMFLNDGPIGRNTIKIDATLVAKSPLSNDTIIKYDGTIYSICATLAEMDNTVVGVVKVHPDGATIVNGNELDVSCGTIRIDIDAYENARTNLTPNTMCNISALTSNKAVTGNTQDLGTIWTCHIFTNSGMVSVIVSWIRNTATEAELETGSEEVLAKFYELILATETNFTNLISEIKASEEMVDTGSNAESA